MDPYLPSGFTLASKYALNIYVLLKSQKHISQKQSMFLEKLLNYHKSLFTTFGEFFSEDKVAKEKE